MINFILGLFSYDLAIDLGTANTLVYVRGKGIAIREKYGSCTKSSHQETLAVGKRSLKNDGKNRKSN